MRELDHKEGWAPKNWCFKIVLLKKTFESPLDCKEIKPVNSKGNQPWVLFGRIDAKAEAPILWPSYANSWLIERDLDAGKNWRQKEKGAVEDEIVRWHHWHSGHEFELLWETVKAREAWHAQSMALPKVGHDLATKQQHQQYIVSCHLQTVTVFSNLDNFYFFFFSDCWG